MNSLPVTTVSRTFALGVLVLGGLAVCGAWNVGSLVKSVNRLVPMDEAILSRIAATTKELSPVDREQRQQAIQALHDQAWWIVAVLLAGAPVIVALVLTANWLVRRELTQRQMTDKRLQERESRLQAILDSEPECINLIAADGTLLEMNAAGLEMIEVGSASQVVGQRVDALVIPEHRRDFQMLTERVFRGESCTLEYEIVGRKGRHRWLDTHASPLRDERGRVIALLGITRDITSRKLAVAAMCAANAQLSATLDAMPDLLFEVDGTGRICDFRAPHPELLYVPPTQFLGKCMHEVLPAAAAQLIDGAIRDAGAKGLHRGTMYSLDLPQGKRWFELSIARKGPESGADSHFVLLSRDITDREQASEELRASRERLAALSRQLIAAQESERRQVACELHDEIGQVLTVVSWNLHHLKSVCGPDTHAELDAGLSLIDRAQTQVRDLSLNLRPPVLDLLGLEAAVRECVEQHRKLIGCDIQLDLRLESRLSPELEITCFRVIQSALTNISRHARASQVSVSMRQDDLGLELSVCDNGVGLDIDSVRRRSEQGEHFGILAMQERVRLVGGTFRIDSAMEPGKGTSIRAHFPLGMPAESRPVTP